MATVDETRWRLTCKYRQLSPVRDIVASLVSLGGGELTTAEQEWVVQHLLDCPFHRRHVLDLDYHRRLVTALAKAGEASSMGLSDALATAFERWQAAQCQADGLDPGWCQKLWTYGPTATGTLGSSCLEPQTTPFRSPEGAECMTLQLSHDMLSGSTGCHEWEAGFWLAEYVLNNASVFKGTQCLELGCGAGLVGVALARAGAAAVLCTDGSAAAVANCRENLALNGVQPPLAHTAVLSWGVEPQTPPGFCPDIVLGSDLLYDPCAIQPLLATITALLHGSAAGGGLESEKRHPPCALIATTKRNPDTLERFLHALEAHPHVHGEAIHAADCPSTRWHHVQSLEAARSRLVLHRITLM